MKISEIVEKYGIENVEDFTTDIQELSLKGIISFDKSFGLRSEKDSKPVFTFTAHIEADCTIFEAVERASAPAIINFQNKNRRKRKAGVFIETLEAANVRLEAMDKEFELKVTALSANEKKELGQEELVQKLNIKKMSAATASELLKQLAAAGFTINS